MKLNKFLILFSILFVAFASCKDNERENETVETVEPADENFYDRLENARVDDDIINAVESNPELSTFATALNAWNVQDSVSAVEGEMIIFAPTNMAYSKINQTTEPENLLAMEDEEMVSYHIIQSGKNLASLREEMRNSQDTLKIATLQGEDLKLSLDGNSLILTGATGDSARVTDSIQAGNGMVYIIDAVLLPRDYTRGVKISNEG